MISTQAELQALIDKLRGVPEVGLDCEFHGEGRYTPKLCLVQIAGGGELRVIDPLAVDLAPLGEILADPSVCKLFHSGENDLPLLARATGKPVRNVFDTQIAAAFVGYGAAPAYTQLVEKVCGVRLSKSSRFTDWAARPLSREQEAYALDDVRHLVQLADTLREELIKRGRLEWAEMATEEMIQKAHAPRDRSRSYLKLGPFRGLSRRQLAVLREAAAWRDRRAEELDRPLQRIAPDDALRQLAYEPPKSAADVSKVRGLQNIGGGAAGLAAAVKHALELPESELPAIPDTRGRDDRVEMISLLLSAALRVRAIELDIAPTILANRDQLDTLAAWRLSGSRKSAPEIPLLSGWRHAAAGEMLVAFLDGQYSLRVDPEAPDGVTLTPTHET